MYVLYVLYVRTTRIPRILYTILCNLAYYSLLYGSIGSILDRASINQLATSNSSPSSYNIVLKASVIFKGTNKLIYRLDIKDDKFNIGEIFTNNKAIRAAY